MQTATEETIISDYSTVTAIDHQRDLVAANIRRVDALLAETPLCYQGDEIKTVSELALGDYVVDTLGRRNVVCKVVKRYKYSVKLERTLPDGTKRCYGSSLHYLRRLIPELEAA